MLFNSYEYAIFLPLVFLFYWFFTKGKIVVQNYLLLISSYYFYSCWDWRFLFLLIFSTFLDFFTGLKMQDAKNPDSKKFWFWVSIIINLGFLGVFKYYNFFADSLASALLPLGIHLNPWTLEVILPVGISFYTFHGLSYVIDIYKNRITAERNFVDYAVFVSFFPLLVAGPIERATHLLPQIKKPRSFNYLKATDGLRQILWGLFKKMVVADNCATYANDIFQNSSTYSGSSLFIGAIFFTFQIYGDFSGYSDIALGTARLFGFELLRNFAFPYFSRDIGEYWRKWHISLSSWFRDYLYIPLGGSHGSTYKKIKNTFIIFTVSGFWHGANWTFIGWGFLNACYFVPLLMLKRNRQHMDITAKGKILPSFYDLISMASTFIMVVFAWILFRADNIKHAIQIYGNIFSRSLFVTPDYSGFSKSLLAGFWILVLIVVEWLGREGSYGISGINKHLKQGARWLLYFIIILVIIEFQGSQQEFIYFQF